MSASPSFGWEFSLLNDSHYDYIIGFDEVGRGAIAGPVVVAAALISRESISSPIPEGLKDSKLISEKQRPIVLEAVQQAYPIWGIAESPASLIDESGIIRSLAAAAASAHMQVLERARSTVSPVELSPANTLLLLDGSHNWLNTVLPEWDSMTKVKGDRDCVSMAAASLIAKVYRDNLMVKLSEDPEYSEYGWGKNKGYGAKIHYEGIKAKGLTDLHRKSWIKNP